MLGFLLESIVRESRTSHHAIGCSVADPVHLDDDGTRRGIVAIKYREEVVTGDF